ncbi:hypothetical protein MSj_02496 [Microcystis aeruginosa Sj]|uniref:Uncharacterized protein n=1 Tax=Microcystis aeruginosa Sj TaxID=1979544 RepID=A0A2Z6V1E4_MICAE|nr:hypothetical protein MSj_02496 [Microcystis aeruginosa Sj]
MYLLRTGNAISEQYLLSEPDQMPVSYYLFTDYCLLITGRLRRAFGNTEKSQA